MTKNAQRRETVSFIASSPCHSRNYSAQLLFTRPRGLLISFFLSFYFFFLETNEGELLTPAFVFNPVRPAPHRNPLASFWFSSLFFSFFYALELSGSWASYSERFGKAICKLSQVHCEEGNLQSAQQSWQSVLQLRCLISTGASNIIGLFLIYDWEYWSVRALNRRAFHPHANKS